MEKKTYTRYFNKKPVRTGWDAKSSSWLYCAIDLIDAFICTSNPRIYWYTVKRRHTELVKHCHLLRLTASDGKTYETDCLTLKGIDCLLDILPSKKRSSLKEWLNGNHGSIEEQSKRRAINLYESGLINEIEVGSLEGLQQIHSFLFDGLYEGSGKISNRNVSKGWFMFTYSVSLSEVVGNIGNMPDETFGQIISKFIQMNDAKPFEDGNGYALRIWLNQMLVEALGKRVDWTDIEKSEYVDAIRASSMSSSQITRLIDRALVKNDDDIEAILKEIDHSYSFGA